MNRIEVVMQQPKRIEINMGTGVRGKSAYEMWLDEGNVGSIGLYMLSLKGERGAKGDKGEGLDYSTMTEEEKDRARGDKGEPGESGIQGIQGIQGIRGKIGLTGDQGIQGERGKTGERGEQGIQGIQGNKGETGGYGLQGEEGPRGKVGPQGERGYQGYRGYQGDPGVRGLTGKPFNYEDFTTEQLLRLIGPKGDRGLTGDRGLQGFKGADSTVPGPRGLQGIEGKQGLSIKGDKGDDGADSIVPGPKGEQGTVGPQGSQGETGDKGEDSIVPGPQGEQGLPGTDGKDGLPGTDGVDGVDGLPGIDGPIYTAGENITIVDNIISSLGGGGSSTPIISAERPTLEDGEASGFAIGDLWVYEQYIADNDYQYEFYQFTKVTEKGAVWIKYGEDFREPPKVYGIKIDETNSNSETAVTYTNDAVELNPMEIVGNNWNDNGWIDIFPFNQIKPCLLRRDGSVNYYLDRNDYTKKEDGSLSALDGTDGQIMIEIPTIYWKIERIGSELFVRYSEEEVDGTYKALAHIREGSVSKYIYIGAYQGTIPYESGRQALASRIGSITGAAQPKSIFNSLLASDTLRVEGFTMFTFYQLTLVQILTLIGFKNLNVREAIGTNFKSGGLGSLNEKPFFWGSQTTKSGIKILGLEDLFPINGTWLEGLHFTDDTTMILNDGNFPFKMNAGETIKLEKTVSQAYMQIPQGTTELGFLPKDTTGSSSTFYGIVSKLGGESGSAILAGGNGDFTSIGLLRVDTGSFTAKHTARLAFFSPKEV